MSDRMDDVLASIDQALDGADDDWTVSGDAMRWRDPETRASEAEDHEGHYEAAYFHSIRPWTTTIPITYTQVDGEAMDELYGLAADDPRIIIRDNLNRIHCEAWHSALERIQADTEADVNGEPDEGSEVFIGFDVVGDTVTYAMVSGDCVWRTGSFPIPDDADEETRSRMGQVVIKGRWTNQPSPETTDARSTT